MRAVLLTGGFEQNRPDGELSDVLLVDRAPHQLLFPRASAVVVHQGGVGTPGQALRSGRPMLVVPHGHDQFDNAHRVTKLGVARTLFPKQYRRRASRASSRVLHGASYRRAPESRPSCGGRRRRRGRKPAIESAGLDGWTSGARPS